MKRTNPKIIILFIILFSSTKIFSAREVAGILEKDEVWTIIESPYLITGNVTIPQNQSLIIKPGVVLKFTEGASLIILGKIRAEGTKNSRIRLQSQHQKKLWGGIKLIDLSNPSASYVNFPQQNSNSKMTFSRGKSRDYNKQLEYTKGSLLSYCIIEDVGTYSNYKNKRFNNVSGAIFCYNTSPAVMNCVLKNNTFIKGGAISCLNYSSPLIKNCTIKNNYSEYGGAGIFCFFFSSPVIVGNIIRNNTTKDNGGAVSINNSSPNIFKNAFINNTTTEKGGGIYVTASDLKIQHNIFKNNLAKQSGAAVFAEASKIKLQGNNFDDQGDIEVYLGIQDTNMISSPDTSFSFDDTLIVYTDTSNVAQNNYWGTTSMSRINYQKVFDREDYPSSMKLNIRNIANYPPAQLPYAPRNISNMKIKYKEEQKKLSNAVIIQGKETRIVLKASGGLPYYKDTIPFWVNTSESDTIGFNLHLTETAPKSNIYTAKLSVGKRTNKKKQQIAGKTGETLSVSMLWKPHTADTFKIIDLGKQ